MQSTNANLDAADVSIISVINVKVIVNSKREYTIKQHI